MPACTGQRLWKGRRLRLPPEPGQDLSPLLRIGGVTPRRRQGSPDGRSRRCGGADSALSPRKGRGQLAIWQAAFSFGRHNNGFSAACQPAIPVSTGLPGVTAAWACLRGGGKMICQTERIRQEFKSLLMLSMWSRAVPAGACSFCLMKEGSISEINLDCF